MEKLRFFDKTKTYIYPDDTVGTPERNAKEFPAPQLDDIKYVVTTDESETMMLGMDMFSLLRSIYQIDPAMSDEDAIVAIESIKNTPPEVDNTPSAEERIAAALEYQVMSSLPDEEEGE